MIRPPNGKAYKVDMMRPKVFHSNEAAKIKAFFNEEGYVVVKNVSDAHNRKALIKCMQAVTAPETNRLGFLDLYHSDELAQMRQDERLRSRYFPRSER